MNETLYESDIFIDATENGPIKICYCFVKTLTKFASIREAPTDLLRDY